jgi:hypothetical protein
MTSHPWLEHMKMGCDQQPALFDNLRCVLGIDACGIGYAGTFAVQCRCFTGANRVRAVGT